MYGLPDSAIYGTYKRVDAHLRKSGFKKAPLFTDLEYAGILATIEFFARSAERRKAKKDKKAQRETGLDPQFTKFTPRDIKAKKVRFVTEGGYIKRKPPSVS